MSQKDLSEVRRREIFLALVQVQDGRMSVAESRRAVAQQYAISEEEVKRIEQEGIDNDWPPL